jgi:hypothetical protein
MKHLIFLVVLFSCGDDQINSGEKDIRIARDNACYLANGKYVVFRDVVSDCNFKQFSLPYIWENNKKLGCYQISYNEYDDGELFILNPPCSNDDIIWCDIHTEEILFPFTYSFVGRKTTLYNCGTCSCKITVSLKGHYERRL